MASGEYVRDMTSKFAKLEKFNGQDFRRWKKKVHFLLTTLKVVYVLSTPCPEIMDDETLEQTRRRLKWENDDYICRGLILNGMSDALFDVHQNDESARQLWDALESKYMAEDTSSKKFLVSNFMNYKMSDSRPSISVSSIIDKLPPSWKDFKHTLKHQKEDLNLVQLGSHLIIEESLRSQEVDKTKGKNQASSSVNVGEDDGKFKKFNKLKEKKREFNDDNKHSNKKVKKACWRCGKPGHFKKDCRVKLSGGNKADAAGPSHVNYVRMKDMSKMSLIPAFDMHDNKWHTCKLTKITRKAFKDVKRDSKVLELIHSDLCDFHSTPSLGNKKYVVTYIDDATRYCYVYLVHTKDETLDKLKVYKQEVELLHGDLIKTLRTDRGGEYYDPVYFQSTGIIHQTATPYIPQQNGVAERKNRTLKEMVNSLLSNSVLI
ncbi:hypothetical protein E3N88_27581 [Mikania micrantha]|uniref:CCHC-type domain-containing protein n=1 Tax=Mikania micrantha TaxID=192012 RepID=A0A5N6MY59_9ASTR|nr:hypothetical protein E3N88_27581 [Mikania micrantha]